MSRYIRTRNRGKKIRVINDCKSSADWTNEDPVLEEGMIGVDATSGKIKCGNGVTPWSGLPYLRTKEMTTESLEQTGGNLLLSNKERSYVNTLKTRKIWEEIYISDDFTMIGYSTLSGDWKIVRNVTVKYGAITTTVSQYTATKTKNSTYDTIHDAWDSRDILIYS